jgi:basic membrane protein A
MFRQKETRMPSRLRAALVLGVAASLSLSACSSNTKAAPAASDSSLQVAIVLPGSVTDAGFNADGKRTGDLLTKELGAKVTLAESTPVPNAPDVMRQFAGQGFDLVLAWGGQFSNAAEAVAPEFEKTHFINVTSKVSNGKNLTGFDLAVEQWQYLAGYAMGKMTKSGVIGFVGGQCFPATGATLEATKEGATAARPGVKFLSTFTGDFEDAGKAQQASQAMIDQGADVLSGNLNNGWLGVIKAAQTGQHLPVFNEWADNHQDAPDVLASSVLKSHAPYLLELARLFQDGKLEGKDYVFDLAEAPALVKTDLLPAEVYAEVEGLQKRIVAGELTIERHENCPS